MEDRPEILGLHANVSRAVGDTEGKEVLDLFYRFHFQDGVAIRADMASLTFEPQDVMKLARYRRKLKELKGKLP